VTRCDGVTTSAGGKTTPGREKERDNASWADTNLIGSKYEENSRDRFSWYK
jgi:hypothetical protein